MCSSAGTHQLAFLPALSTQGLQTYKGFASLSARPVPREWGWWPCAGLCQGRSLQAGGRGGPSEAMGRLPVSARSALTAPASAGRCQCASTAGEL